MVFSTFTFKGLLGQLSESSLSKHLTCVSRTYSQLQPTNLTYFSPLISRQVVGALTCPNTSLVSPGPTPNLSLSRYSQCSSPGKLSEFSLSKHLTCVSRTYSQLQPVEILQAFQNMSLQAINWQVTFLKWPYSQHATKMKWNKSTSPKSRLLKLFDALDFTSARYQPSVDCKPLVQAQHRSSAKIQELNTNDSSFTLDGVLSTLQQGSAENGVGSSVELRYHVKKRRAQICGQIQRFIQNFYRTTQADAYVNHTHQTSAARVVTNLIKLKHCRVKKTVSPSTPTCWRQAPSFRSRRNTISHRETKHNKQTETKKDTKRRYSVPSVGLSYVKLCDTAALVH